jgi:hypothetical protein
MSINRNSPSEPNPKVLEIPMTVIINASASQAEALEEDLNTDLDNGETLRPVVVLGKISLLGASNHPSAYHRRK